MTTEEELQEALENCDREPIHIPGSIQSFGALIATDKKLGRIEYASENADTYLGFKTSELLGKPISMLLDNEEAHVARNALTHATITDQREVVGEKIFSGMHYQISIHLKDERAVLEFLPCIKSGTAEAGAIEKTRALLAGSVSEQDFEVLLNTSVENLRISTGYDRVKAYRFLPDGTGEVVAESRASHTDSFLGLRFPASDIPPVARRLYSSTPIRVIADVNAINTPVMGISAEERPLDLSLAVLRGTSDVHTRYLTNMGVRATMTLPIIVDGEMWGLFSMHHMKPRIPDPTMLIAAELSGKMLSLVIQHTKQTRHNSHLNNCRVIANQLFVDDSRISVRSYWESHRNNLMSAIPSDGIAYIDGDQVDSSGNTPNRDGCLAIRTLVENDSLHITPLDDLINQLPDSDLGGSAGVLVMPLSLHRKTYIMLFRKQAAQDIKWAGEPNKDIVKSKRGLELNPRNSFTQYLEKVTDKSDEWSHEDMEVAAVLQTAFTQSMQTQLDRKATQQRLRLMVRELNHRVRNILTLVQSLSSNSKASATSLEGYATALEQRIVALAGAHDLLTRQDMRGVRLRQIATLELRPYLDSSNRVASLSGPDVILNPDAAPIIALVFHELTSNAVKYGALSSARGKVELDWAVTDNGLEIKWSESGGPPVSTPTREGFGSSIINNAIPYECAGKADLSFVSSGLEANFFLPASEFDLEDDRRQTLIESQTKILDTNKVTAGLKRGLIVEDNYVIAMEAKRWFKELGFEDTHTVATVENALTKLDEEQYDFCLLDVNLRGEVSEPVARKLLSMGTPYVFASGYGSEGSELCDQFDTPFLTKPVNLDDLRAVVKELGVVG